MRMILLATAVCLVCAMWIAAEAAAPQSTSAPSVPQAAAGHRALLSEYCVVCHNDRAKTAGLSLASIDLTDVAADAHVLEKVVRKLRMGEMPPQGARRPDQATLDRLVVWLEDRLDRAAAARPNPGQPLVHRLNRTEYANAIRDLLSMEVDVRFLLPPDDAAYGFDNISDVLGLSPVQVERYLSAAEWISARAVGELPSPGAETYLVRQDRSQDQHVEGLPFGTVGGLAVRHTFPADGEYDFQIALLRTNTDALIGLELPHQLEITVDGKRVLLETIGGDGDQRPRTRNRRDPQSQDEPTEAPAPSPESRLRVRVPVAAGPRLVTAAFLQQRGVGTRRLQSFIRSTASPYDPQGSPHIRTLAITGPYNVTGPGDTPSRRKILICHPHVESGQAAAARPAVAPRTERACASQIVSTLARRAFRRPVTEEDLQPLLAFYDSGRREGTFEKGIQKALQRILASPKFILRVEHEPVNVARGAAFRITDVDLASRLSFFLWSSIPDDQLVDLASRRRLRDSAVLEEQVQRMLADPRAEALVENFGGQWLQLRNLKTIIPDPNEFPDFDDQLREAFVRETELLLGSVIREDRSVLELLTADYTFANERLARHYGIPNVYGSHFRRVAVPQDARRGLLGHGSILTVTSHATRTAPVLRGKWIMDNLLGMPPPPPPPNANTDLAAVAEGEKPPTMRQRMEAHRANPACASCHKLMDPLGLAMEHFDAVGAWRTRDEGEPIDAATVLAEGTKVNGVVELRQALLNRPDVLVGTITEKLLVYALGRGLQPSDMPIVRAIVRETRAQDYRFSSLILGIARSTPFQMRMAGAE